MTLAEALAESAACPKCGTRMWPADQLEEHVLMHEIRDLVYAGQLADVQRRFRRMRFPGETRESREGRVEPKTKTAGKMYKPKARALARLAFKRREEAA